MTDHAGDLTYISPEWSTVTGLSVSSSFGNGWEAAVHPDDRPAILPTFRAAVRAKTRFSLQFRLRHAGGGFIWVVSGAVPSLDTQDEFIGFLGSVTKVETLGFTPLQAGGRLGSFEPPFPHSDTLAHKALDLVADHLLIAFSLIKEDGGKSALPALRTAILRVAVELAASGATTPVAH